MSELAGRLRTSQVGQIRIARWRRQLLRAIRFSLAMRRRIRIWRLSSDLLLRSLVRIAVLHVVLVATKRDCIFRVFWAVLGSLLVVLMSPVEHLRIVLHAGDNMQMVKVVVVRGEGECAQREG